MKYINKLLLATTLAVSTLGMSLSANAGAIIKQDIYLDVDTGAGDFADDPNAFGLTEDLGQLIGSITYATQDADGLGEIALEDIVLELVLGGATLGNADVLAGANPVLLAANGAIDGIENFIADLDFSFGGFDYELGLEADITFGGSFILFDVDAGFETVIGQTRLGAVTYVPEPSALFLVLVGLGLLVRRKIKA